MLTSNQLELIEWINNASYEDLLKKWRFAPPGPLFIDKVGQHFLYTMTDKRNKCDYVKISKKVGW